MRISAVLNMPPAMGPSSYDCHSKTLHKAAAAVAEDSMAAAANEHRARVDDTDGADICNTAVTYDGTWMRRGFASLYGVFVAIS